jgi:hypothetical protein
MEVEKTTQRGALQSALYIRVIKPGSMRWVEYMHTGFWWGDQRERDHLGEQDADGRIILKRIFRKWGYTPVLSGQGHVAGACEGSNKSSFSKKIG